MGNGTCYKKLVQVFCWGCLHGVHRGWEADPSAGGQHPQAGHPRAGRQVAQHYPQGMRHCVSLATLLVSFKKSELTWLYIYFGFSEKIRKHFLLREVITVPGSKFF